VDDDLDGTVLALDVFARDWRIGDGEVTRSGGGFPLPGVAHTQVLEVWNLRVKQLDISLR
jgi:hypothetical protein